jgi:hypothetical protein
MKTTVSSYKADIILHGEFVGDLPVSIYDRKSMIIVVVIIPRNEFKEFTPGLL